MDISPSAVRMLKAMLFVTENLEMVWKCIYMFIFWLPVTLAPRGWALVYPLHCSICQIQQVNQIQGTFFFFFVFFNNNNGESLEKCKRYINVNSDCFWEMELNVMFIFFFVVLSIKKNVLCSECGNFLRKNTVTSE